MNTFNDIETIVEKKMDLLGEEIEKNKIKRKLPKKKQNNQNYCKKMF